MLNSFIPHANNKILYTMYLLSSCGVFLCESQGSREGSWCELEMLDFGWIFGCPVSLMIILIGKKLDSTCKGQFSGYLWVNIKIPRAFIGNLMTCLITELTFSNRVLVNFLSKYIVIIRSLYMVRKELFRFWMESGHSPLWRPVGLKYLA